MIPDYFDATGIPPIQSGGGHPVGSKFPFTITNTSIAENKTKTGGMLVVEMTSPVGKIENRYNLFNPSDVAVKIAQQELSALCHAVGRFKLSWPKDGAGNLVYSAAGQELRGAVGMMDVEYQKGHNPATDGPNAKGYTEVAKVYDAQGNEPGKAPAQAQPQQQQAQPQPTTAPNANGGWGGGPAASNPPANPPASGAGQWGAPAANPPANPPANPNGGAAWAPGPTASPGGGAPWAK